MTGLYCSGNVPVEAVDYGSVQCHNATEAAEHVAVAFTRCAFLWHRSCSVSAAENSIILVQVWCSAGTEQDARSGRCSGCLRHVRFRLRLFWEASEVHDTVHLSAKHSVWPDWRRVRPFCSILQWWHPGKQLVGSLIGWLPQRTEEVTWPNLEVIRFWWFIGSASESRIALKDFF